VNEIAVNFLYHLVTCICLIFNPTHISNCD